MHLIFHNGVCVNWRPAKTDAQNITVRASDAGRAGTTDAGKRESDQGPATDDGAHEPDAPTSSPSTDLDEDEDVWRYGSALVGGAEADDILAMEDNDRKEDDGNRD